MKISDVIDTVLATSKVRGTYAFSDLLAFTKDNGLTGLAVADEKGRRYCLAVMRGEPEGAVYTDDKGELYGDKAVMMFKEPEKFVFYDVSEDIVEAVVMGCRIFEKTHLRKSTTQDLPEFGKKRAGMGVLTILINRHGVPENGLRVSVWKDGRIVGSDITTQDGTVSFKLMYDRYDCVVQDKDQKISSYHLTFSEMNPKASFDIY